MKRYIITLFVVAILAMSDQAAFAKGPIVIKALPVTISVPGQYILGGNLISTSSGIEAITITADNVVLDMGGYGIKGQDSGTAAGIYVVGTGVDIKNGFVTDFYDGIVSSSVGVRVINVRTYSNNHYGILLEGNGSLVKDCAVEDNTDTGIAMINGIAVGNIVHGSIVGISAPDGRFTATGNAVYDNNAGISCGPGSLISDNVVYGNVATYGIESTAGYCFVNNNAIYHNGETSALGNLVLLGSGNVPGINLAP